MKVGDKVMLMHNKTCLKNLFWKSPEVSAGKIYKITAIDGDTHIKISGSNHVFFANRFLKV